MAAPVVFDFEGARLKFVQGLHSSSGPDEEQLAELYTSVLGSDTEKKLAVDQAFKDLVKEIQDSNDGEKSTEVVQRAINAVTKELCNATIPFILLSDVFDSLTLQHCENVFLFVEHQVNTWKSDVFYSAGKNYLLRMCNDLLRRLSKSQNTIFCGRIQLFLARLFPLDERSGLNLMSHFNLDNLTTYITTPEDYLRSRKQSADEKEKMENMDIEEGEMDESFSSPPIDYTLYRKFWSLQDYFRRPVQCYEKLPWKTFINHSSSVLQTFGSYKLDDTKTQRQKLEQLKQQAQSNYFAKYLTSEKLLDLQLSDSNFRRQVLIQFLILFQYLNATVKFKNSSQVLSDEQNAWVKETSVKVYGLLRETPPDGAAFAKAIEHILSREENWSSWKNDACPSFVRQTGPNDAESKIKAANRPKKRSIGDDMKVTGSKVIKMGNPELTRLWNINHSHMDACRSEKRQFMPSLGSFFEDAVEQADPEQMVEEKYKLVNNPTWSWKALRLLGRKSHHFHNQQSIPKAKIADYINDMMKRETNELKLKESQNSQEEAKSSCVDLKADTPPESQDMAEDSGNHVSIDEADKKDAEKVKVDAVTKNHVTVLSSKISDDWKKLASHLKFPADEIDYIEGETSDKEAQAKKMLTIWMENEGEKATKTLLRSAMVAVELKTAAESVLG